MDVIGLIVGIVGGIVANAGYSWISGKASVMFARIATVSPIDVAALVVAIAALLVAIIAVVPAFKALGASRSASESADEANRLAHEANELVSGQVARETERHDVDWGWDWEKPGVALVVNEGHESTAYDVRVTLWVAEETVIETASRVAPGESLRLEFPGALAEFVREVQELEEERHPRRSPSNPYGLASPSVLTHSPMRHLHHYGLGALWITERGTPKKQGAAAGTTYLGDHDEALRRRRLRGDLSTD